MIEHIFEITHRRKNVMVMKRGISKVIVMTLVFALIVGFLPVFTPVAKADGQKIIARIECETNDKKYAGVCEVIPYVVEYPGFSYTYGGRINIVNPIPDIWYRVYVTLENFFGSDVEVSGEYLGSEGYINSMNRHFIIGWGTDSSTLSFGFDIGVAYNHELNHADADINFNIWSFNNLIYGTTQGKQTSFLPDNILYPDFDLSYYYDYIEMRGGPEGLWFNNQSGCITIGATDETPVGAYSIYFAGRVWVQDLLEYLYVCSDEFTFHVWPAKTEAITVSPRDSAAPGSRIYCDVDMQNIGWGFSEYGSLDMRPYDFIVSSRKEAIVNNSPDPNINAWIEEGINYEPIEDEEGIDYEPKEYYSRLIFQLSPDTPLGTYTVSVTCDGVTSKEFEITVDIDEDATLASLDIYKVLIVEVEIRPNLFGFKISTNGIVFSDSSPDITEYTIEIPCSEEHLYFKAVPNSSKASASISGATKFSDSAFLVELTGKDSVDIVVTAESGDTLTYRINIIYLPDDATLKSLAVVGRKLSEDFSSTIDKYTAYVPSGETSITVSAIPNDSNATIVGAGTYIIGEDEETTIFITVTAKDEKTKKIYQVDIKRGEPPRINHDLSVLYAAVGEKFTTELKLDKGTLPVGWEINGPDWLDNDKGIISGTPPEKGRFPVTFSVENNYGEDNWGFIIEAGYAPKITTIGLPSVAAGTEYRELLEATGDEPIIWNIVKGKLPDGLRLDLDGKGIITGTPNKREIASFTVQAKNNYGSQEKELSIEIIGVSPIITTVFANGWLPDATVDVAYPYVNIEATGTQPISWSAVNLPRGMWIYSDGTITGTPVTEGDMIFSVTAKNAYGEHTKIWSIYVKPADESDTTLSALGISAGKLSPDFAPYWVGEYNVSVNNNVDSISITPKTRNPDAKVSGTLWKSLSVGDNIIEFTVTAKDGITTKLYTIRVSRAVPYTSKGNDLSSSQKATQSPNQEDKVGLEDEDTPMAEKLNPFEDVAADAWYAESIVWVYNNKLMVGTNTIPMLFNPNMPATRNMIVTVMYRLAGSPDISGLNNPFNDVPTGQWYTNAVIWAAENGIVAGDGNDRYWPMDNATREQLAAIFFYYYKYIGKGPQGAWMIRLDFADLADFSDWALEPVAYCKLKGVINGKPGNIFDPKGIATRAELAAMLMRFMAADETE